MRGFIRRYRWIVVFEAIVLVAFPGAMVIADEQWPALKDWQSLAGAYLAVVAGSFVIIGAMVQAQSEERAEQRRQAATRRMVATALLSEVEMMARTFRVAADPTYSSRETREARHFRINEPEVYRAYLPRLGVLPVDIVRRLILLYGSFHHFETLLALDSGAGARIAFSATMISLRLRKYLDAGVPAKVSDGQFDATAEEITKASAETGYTPAAGQE